MPEPGHERSHKTRLEWFEFPGQDHRRLRQQHVDPKPAQQTAQRDEGQPDDRRWIVTALVLEERRSEALRFVGACAVDGALDAMIAFGRPSKVELLVLIDRKFTRQLPIEPDYVGKSVNTIQSQVVEVDWQEQGHKKDKIWLIDKED